MSTTKAPRKQAQRGHRRSGVVGRRRNFRATHGALEETIDHWLELNVGRFGFPDLGELALLFYFSYADPRIAKLYEAQMIRLAPKMLKAKVTE